MMNLGYEHDRLSHPIIYAIDLSSTFSRSMSSGASDILIRCIMLYPNQPFGMSSKILLCSVVVLFTY
jgi:hypothetical protein